MKFPPRKEHTTAELQALLGQAWTPVKGDPRSVYRGLPTAWFDGWVEDTGVYAQTGIPHHDWDEDAFGRGGYVR